MIDESSDINLIQFVASGGPGQSIYPTAILGILFLLFFKKFLDVVTLFGEVLKILVIFFVELLNIVESLFELLNIVFCNLKVVFRDGSLFGQLFNIVFCNLKVVFSDDLPCSIDNSSYYSTGSRSYEC